MGPAHFSWEQNCTEDECRVVCACVCVFSKHFGSHSVSALILMDVLMCLSVMQSVLLAHLDMAASSCVSA